MMKKHTGRIRSLASPRKPARGFTLVELLVVIGIISLLISMLLPAITRMRQNAMSLKCKAQMRDIGMQLEMYSNENRGVMFPVGEMYFDAKSGINKWKTLGYETKEPDLGRGSRWPVPVFHIRDEYTEGTYDKTKPITSLTVTNPEILKCPSDLEPKEDHTYILNKHLAVNTLKGVKRGSTVRDVTGAAKSSSDVVLMGEKKNTEPDYYMEATPASEFARVVEPYRHGIKLGSNYLYLDGHVDIVPPSAILDALDSWDPIGDSTLNTDATPNNAPN